MVLVTMDACPWSIAMRVGHQDNLATLCHTRLAHDSGEKTGASFSETIMRPSSLVSTEIKIGRVSQLIDIIDNAFKNAVKFAGRIVAFLALLRSCLVVTELVGSLQLQPMSVQNAPCCVRVKRSFTGFPSTTNSPICRTMNTITDDCRIKAQELIQHCFFERMAA